MDTTLTFKEILESSSVGLTGGGSITLAFIITSLIVSLITGLFIAFIYRKAYLGVLFQKSFAMTLVLVTLVTTMVIMVISGNLILSLGMVGALSIVRFRAAIKDPLDIVYVFWAVGVGIANGVAYFSVSVVSSIFIGLCLWYFSSIPSRPRSKLLVINCEVGVAKDIESILLEKSKKIILRSKTEKDGINEFVYEVMDYESEDIFANIRTINGVQQLRILNYSANN
mgnify:CR=1 FL=1